MSTYQELLSLGRDRAAAGQLPYAGALTPEEANSVLRLNPDARLVDVRTNAERDWVGKVIIPEQQHLSVQWSLYPGASPNPDFLEQLGTNADKNTPILFLCRSGVRSRHAAKLATEAGYAHCFDILEGFEGDRDTDGHRKTVNGWCKAGLPWIGA
ncbi:rhodanese-like domain-containing protein [Actimicrobium antarcticum]|uniref:Rhodanese-like domain-containing protein n=1 Tax=Actimicrobium antarcticum TaxID=1051899 RepID=A0ABP7SPI9_9BURK